MSQPPSPQEQNQKRLELEQFSEFASVCASIPPDIPRQPRPPEPDIVLPGPHGPIGIELTDITLGAKGQRAYEREQQHRMNAAKKLYHARGNTPISAWFAWAEGASLRASDRARDARIICELIEQDPPTGKGVLLHEIGDGMSLIRPDLPLTQIMIGQARSEETADWRDGSFHQVEPYGAPEIQAKIRQEDPKVARYQLVYASRWLLLVLEAEGPSTWGVVLKRVSESTFDSRFDRVFLFELRHGRCHELKLS